MRIYTFRMKLNKIIFSITVLVLLFFAGCERTVDPSAGSHEGDGHSTISISLNTATVTKAGTAKDGGVMNTLHIWIADGSGNIVYKGKFDGDSVSGEKFSFVMDQDKKTATATFVNVERGDYMMYIVANLPASMSELAEKESADADFTDAELPELDIDDTRPPFTDANGDMPLSMRQKIHIGPGVNRIETQLVRVCGRVRVTVRNMTTDKNIFLQSLKLTDRNPSTGFLFHKDDHGTPADIRFGAFDKFELSGTETTSYIAPGKDSVYINQYLYETGLTGMGKLGFEIIGGIYEGSVTSAEVVPAVEAGSETIAYKADVDYLIKNESGKFYLNDDGSVLSASLCNNLELLLLDADLNNYIWNFSEDGPTGTDQKVFLKNVGTGRYLSLPYNSSTSSYGYEMSKNETLVRAFVRVGAPAIEISPSVSQWNVLNFYLNGLRVSYYSTTDPSYYWKLIPVSKTGSAGSQLKDALKTFDRVNDSITYIDQYGLPVTLEHICRNDDVNIIINVFYSPESGVLYFEVDDWTDVTNDTTFD